MLIVTQKAEATLLKDLKTYWERYPKYRCLQLKLSLHNTNTQKETSDLLRYTQTYLEDETLKIYVCQDHDIFILARTLTQKRADDFLTHLSSKLSLLSLSPQRAATLFEVGVDWPKLRTICEAKLDAIEIFKNREERKKEATLEKIDQTKILKTLNPNLLTSLSMRRKDRDKAEIMVVEDDLFSQRLIRNALKNEYSLSITGDGQGALMNYVSKAPDVLFLDIGLPDMDGHQVLEMIFKIDPSAYVVMFSGNGDRENIMKAINLGAKGFVGKPFTQEKLLQYIQKSPFIQSQTNKENTHANTQR